VKGQWSVNAEKPIKKGPKNAPIIRSLGIQTSSVANDIGILLFRCRCECMATPPAPSAAVTVT